MVIDAFHLAVATVATESVAHPEVLLNDGVGRKWRRTSMVL